MKKVILGFFKFILVIILLAFVILTLYTRFSKNPEGLFGYKIYTIISASMEPKLKIGDVILVKNIQTKDIKPGDVIVYKGMESDYKNKIITHQVEQIVTEDSRYIFYTKGLANNAIDPAVYEEQIMGKVIYKPIIISLISRLIRTFWGFFIIVIVPLIIIFILEFKQLGNSLKKKEN